MHSLLSGNELTHIYETKLSAKRRFYLNLNLLMSNFVFYLVMLLQPPQCSRYNLQGHRIGHRVNQIHEISHEVKQTPIQVPNECHTIPNSVTTRGHTVCPMSSTIGNAQLHVSMFWNMLNRAGLNTNQEHETTVLNKDIKLGLKLSF